MCSPAHASSTARRRRSWRRCSTKAATCARSGRCIGSWPRIGRSGSGAINASIPGTPNPELVAAAPNQTWSWDITKLLGPTKWTYFHLYVVLDIFSRYAVGWMVADRENSALAGRLIEETCHKQGVQPRGAHTALRPRRADDQQVHRTTARRSRRDPLVEPPQVSDDNPFSEAQFKTLKYHPGFPGRFHDITAAIAFCRTFFPGTTPSIAMAGSRCSPRTTSIIIEPRACWTSAGAPFKPPGRVIPNASFEASHNQTPFPKRSGSIHP